jgi:hypothetical protein
MRTLSRLHLEAEEVYKRISGARREPVRGRLLASEGKVLQAYERYEEAAGLCALLDPADVLPALPEDLTGNYTYLGKSLPEWRGAILANNTGGRCPMCAVGRASTLDHYLPEGIFPEFASLPLNLVPACSICQKHKRELYRGDGSPLFLQLYFDELPVTERFLFADVDVVGTSISLDYRVDPPGSISQGLGQRLESHFSRLRLREIYVTEGVGEFSDKRSELERLLTSGATADDVSEYLRHEAATVAASRGVNHWRAVALSAFSESHKLCSGAFRAE